jgi:hypothetical protein
MELGLIGLPFHLDVVSAPVSPAGLSQPGLQATVGRQQQKAFAVSVQTANRIDPWNGNELCERAPLAQWFGGELAQHTVRLVQEKGFQGSLMGGLCPLQ